MREIGTLPDPKQAARLGDFLLAEGISNRVENSDGQASIWVFDEDRVDQAREELARFVEEPDHSRYAAAASAARAVERDQNEKERQFRKNYVDMRNRWAGPTMRSRPVTMVLLAASVLATLATGFFTTTNVWSQRLSFIPYTVKDGQIWTQANDPLLQSLSRGEVWRLVTPIFMHGGVFHLLFNMYWLMAFGTLIEFRQGSVRMALLVLVTAILSNLAQYLWPAFPWPGGTPSPLFGGMSGVVYGLFGYIWMQSRYDPQCGFRLPESTIVILVVWLFLCMTPVLDSFVRVANAAHAGGFVVGAVIGVAAALWRQSRHSS